MQALIEADLAGGSTAAGRMGFSAAAPTSSLIDFGLEGWGGDSLMEFCQSHHIYITLPIPLFSTFYLSGHIEDNWNVIRVSSAKVSFLSIIHTLPNFIKMKMWKFEMNIDWQHFIFSK